MKQSILYLTPYPPVRSGIADYAKSFKQAIEQYTDWRLELGIRQRNLECNSIKDLRILRHQVQEWMVDGTLSDVALIHAEIGYHQHQELYTLFWLRQLNPTIPYCITVHDPPLLIAPAFKFLSLGLTDVRVRHLLRVIDYTFLARMAVASLLNRAQRVFVLSKVGTRVTQQLLTKKKRNQVIHVPMIAMSSLYNKHYKIKSNNYINILFMGFWGPSKGIEILIEAFTLVEKQARIPCRLFLAGTIGDKPEEEVYRNKILQLVARSSACDHIHVTGYCSADKLQQILDETDIFVLPYLQSPGFSASAALIRAMAAGTAIIASEVGVLCEEVCHMENALLVKPGDVQALVESIIKLVDNPDLRHKLGATAQQQIQDKHNHEVVANLFKDHYDTILS